MTAEQALKSGLRPVNGNAGFKKLVLDAQGPVSAIVRYIRKGGDIYLRTSQPINASRIMSIPGAK